MAVQHDHRYANRFLIRFRVNGDSVHCALLTSQNLRQSVWVKRGEFTVFKGRQFDDLRYAFWGVEFKGETEADTAAYDATRKWTDADWAEEREHGYASD